MSVSSRDDELQRVDPAAVRRITPFVRPPIHPDQLPPDYLSLLSFTFGIAGLMFKSTWASWASIFCCVSCLGNMKANETDLKQIGCCVLFSSTGLLMNCFGPTAHR